MEQLDEKVEAVQEVKTEKVVKEKKKNREKKETLEVFGKNREVKASEYDALELASLLSQKYQVRSDLVLVALLGKEKCSVKEAEALVFALKKRKVN